MQLDWPSWMKDDVWQFIIAGISIPVIGIIVAIILALRSKRPSKVSSIDGDDNIQVINSPGTVINKTKAEKLDTRYDQLTQEIQKEMNVKTEREIEEILKTINGYATAYDYTKAINFYDENRNVLDANKDKFEKIIKQIEILISEAKNG